VLRADSSCDAPAVSVKSFLCSRRVNPFPRIGRLWLALTQSVQNQAGGVLARTRREPASSGGASACVGLAGSYPQSAGLVERAGAGVGLGIGRRRRPHAQHEAAHPSRAVALNILLTMFVFCSTRDLSGNAKPCEPFALLTRVVRPMPGPMMNMESRGKSAAGEFDFVT
jgi:hypothetical protein